MTEARKEELKQKIASRKLIMCLVLFGIATVALFTGYAVFAAWTEFMRWLFGIYVVGNVFEHGTRALNGRHGG